MSDSNPVTGPPYGGRDDKPDDAPLPGERPASRDEQTVEPPDTSGESETGSRAAESGPMGGGDTDPLRPSPGIPEQVHAPSPADATDADPPGGSAANQPGRAPDQ
jgi:hypothetical protein